MTTHLTSIFTFFSFSSDGAPRDLHSFPTRRSSDLACAGRSPRTRVGRAAPGGKAVSERQPGRQIRSEEHTSELQSHSDLVCRLLLEKKKKTRERGRHLAKFGEVHALVEIWTHCSSD